MRHRLSDTFRAVQPDTITNTTIPSAAGTKSLANAPAASLTLPNAQTERSNSKGLGNEVIG